MPLILQPVLVIALSFYDRDLHEARLHLNLASSTSFDDARATAEEFIAIVTPLSDGILPHYVIRWHYYDSDHSKPAPGPNARRKLQLFYRNESDQNEAIIVPSPKSALFETSGDLAGIRADATASDLLPFTEDSASTLGPFTTVEGEAFPTIYVRGGLAK